MSIERRFAILLLGLGGLAAAPFVPGRGPAADEAPAGGAALFDYVAKPDAAFQWTEHARYARGSTAVVELRLHSQTWRNVLWKHRLFLIRPERIATEDQALLVIGGGRWEEAYEAREPPESLPEDADVFLAMAETMQSLVAVVGTVPFQPLLGRTEDELIAHTLDAFLRDGDSEWPLLLPMVKSAVRAMDATQAAARALWGLGLERFTVTGGSKRGWTAWLTAAVDARVAAVAPLVFDAVNMAAHFRHQTEAWGAPSRKIRPYTDLGLHRVLGSEEGEALRRIIDPYAYRTRLTLPKLIVNATNDEYFPIDSLNLYWDELADPKYLLYVPNEPHSIDDVELVVPSILALHRAASGGAPMPQLAWEYRRDDERLRLCIRSDPAPDAAVYWRASSEDRDFRDERWTPLPLERRGDTYVLGLPRPAAGFAAVYADLTFSSGRAPFLLSTNPAVVGATPGADVTPPPPSHGRACDAAP